LQTLILQRIGFADQTALGNLLQISLIDRFRTRQRSVEPGSHRPARHRPSGGGGCGRRPRQAGQHQHPPDRRADLAALLLRDYRRSHDGERDVYATMKRGLADRPGLHGGDYSTAKMPWISVNQGRGLGGRQSRSWIAQMAPLWQRHRSRRQAEPRFNRQRSPRKPLVIAGPILIDPCRGHIRFIWHAQIGKVELRQQPRLFQVRIQAIIVTD